MILSLLTMSMRHDGHPVELTGVVCSQIENPYPDEHELPVQGVLLAPVECADWRQRCMLFW